LLCVGLWWGQPPHTQTTPIVQKLDKILFSVFNNLEIKIK
jgi:hypothetical protein